LKWALRHPERFAAAASLSGALDIARRQRDSGVHIDQGQDDQLMHRIFGDRPVSGTDNDLFALLDRIDPAAAPSLYVSCGTEDVLCAENRRFAHTAADRDLLLFSDFGPGDHDWGYWDAGIQDVLGWLPLAAPEG
jgi:S-formylglutathione hydrolase FrmB